MSIADKKIQNYAELKKLNEKLIVFHVSCLTYNTSLPSAMFQAAVCSGRKMSDLKEELTNQLRLNFPSFKDLEISTVLVSEKFAVTELDFISAGQLFTPGCPVSLKAFLSPVNTPQKSVKSIESKISVDKPKKAAIPAKTSTSDKRKIEAVSDCSDSSSSELELDPKIISKLDENDLASLPLAKECKKLGLSVLIKNMGGHKVVKKLVNEHFAKKNDSKKKIKLSQSEISFETSKKIVESSKKRGKVSKKLNDLPKKSKNSEKCENKTEKVKKVVSSKPKVTKKVTPKKNSETLKNKNLNELKKSLQKKKKGVNITDEKEAILVETPQKPTKISLTKKLTKNDKKLDNSDEPKTPKKNPKAEKSKQQPKEKNVEKKNGEKKSLMPKKAEKITQKLGKSPSEEGKSLKKLSLKKAKSDSSDSDSDSSSSDDRSSKKAKKPENKKLTIDIFEVASQRIRSKSPKAEKSKRRLSESQKEIMSKVKGKKK